LSVQRSGWGANPVNLSNQTKPPAVFHDRLPATLKRQGRKPVICIGCDQSSGECIRANPLDEARRYQELAKDAGSKAALSNQLGITPARVSQVIGLLRLAPRIQEYIRALGSEAVKKGIKASALRPIVLLRDSEEQYRAFLNLIFELGLPAQFGGDGKPSQAV
jgi:hypothetical protein